MTQARFLVLAAVGVGVLYIAGFAALGTLPELGDSPAEVAAWLEDHESGARAYAWTATFGSLLFAIVAAIVRGLLPGPQRDVFLIGAVAFVAETTVQAWIWGALALRPGELDPGTARALLDVAVFWGPLLTGATMAMIGAVTVLGLGERKLIPRWLTVLGAIAFVEQAIETVTVFGTDGFIAPGGPMNVVLGATLFAIWFGGLVYWAAKQLSTAGTPRG